MINRIEERISARVSSQLPEFIRADYPTFVTFLERYYEYLEQDTYAQELLQNATKYRDIDSTIDSLINVFLQNYGPGLPLEIITNKKVVIKYLRDFFKSKGNNLSFKYLFRILYGVDVEITKPFDYVLKASDGNWNEPKVIKAYVISGDPFVLKNTRIRGLVSNSYATIIEVTKHYDNNLEVIELLIQPGSIEGNFLVDELSFGSKLITRTTVEDQKLAYTFTGNNRKFVEKLYTTYFERTGETSGVDFWTNVIDTNTLTRRQVEFDTFLVGEQSGCFIRPYSILTGIQIHDGGFGYKINDDILINSKGYIGKGIVTKVQDTGDLSDFGAIQEAKLIHFSPKANGFAVPSYTQQTSFPIPSGFHIPSVLASQSINVKASPYFALGNGSSLDDANIQNALNAAGSLAVTIGRANVYIPSGTYILSGYLDVPSNVTVFGAGSSTIIKKQSSTARTTNLIFRNVVNSNVVISDLTIEGNKAFANITSNSNENYGIVNYLANNNIFTNLLIANTYGIGLGISEGYRHLIKNVTVTGTGMAANDISEGFWSGSSPSGKTSEIYYINCEAYNNDLDGLIIGVSNVYIYGGKFHNNGLIMYPSLISGALGAAGIYGDYTNNISNIFITEAVCYNNSESGIDLRANNITITNCRSFNNGLTGIRIEGFSNQVNISNCIIYDNGANTTINVNQQYWSKSGIGFDGTSNLVIIDNIIGDTRQGNAKTQRYGVEFMNAGKEPGASTTIWPASKFVTIRNNYIEGNKIAASNIDPSVYTYANLQNLTYVVNSIPDASIYTPNIKIRGSYYTSSSNVLYATMTYDHGLNVGDNVLVRFTGNSNSYLQEIQRASAEEYSIYQVETVPFRNQFTIDVAGPSSGTVVIYADSALITTDNTLYRADISTNLPVVTSGYLFILRSKQANLSLATGVIGTYLGKWNKQDSLLSDLTVVQGRALGATENDAVKYQPFSYSVESSLDSSVWDNVTKNILHPAGLARFSDYTRETVIEAPKSSNVLVTIS
jgi:hypothetical protein